MWDKWLNKTWVLQKKASDGGNITKDTSQENILRPCLRRLCHVCSVCTFVPRETQLQTVRAFVERIVDHEGAGMLTC